MDCPSALRGWRTTALCPVDRHRKSRNPGIVMIDQGDWRHGPRVPIRLNRSLRAALICVIGALVVSVLSQSVAAADTTLARPSLTVLDNKYVEAPGNKDLKHNIPDLELAIDGSLVRADFLAHFGRTGGIERWGYPTSEVLVIEPNTLTQFYQRGVVDFHNLGSGWIVERRLVWDYLGGGLRGSPDLGVEPGVLNPHPGTVAGPWGHKISNFAIDGTNTGFADFVERLGGVAAFGFPKTDARVDSNLPGTLHVDHYTPGIVRQYFQAAVVELHPGDPIAPVKLALLGDVLRELLVLDWANQPAFRPARELDPKYMFIPTAASSPPILSEPERMVRSALQPIVDGKSFHFTERYSSRSGYADFVPPRRFESAGMVESPDLLHKRISGYGLVDPNCLLDPVPCDVARDFEYLAAYGREYLRVGPNDKWINVESPSSRPDLLAFLRRGQWISDHPIDVIERELDRVDWGVEFEHQTEIQILDRREVIRHEFSSSRTYILSFVTNEIIFFLDQADGRLARISISRDSSPRPCPEDLVCPAILREPTSSVFTIDLEYGPTDFPALGRAETSP